MASAERGALTADDDDAPRTPPLLTTPKPLGADKRESNMIIKSEKIYKEGMVC
jgi:hypothetical protein